MKYGFLKIAALTPKLRAGALKHNTQAVAESIIEAHASGAQLAVFPELCLTGGTCQSMFRYRAVAEQAESCLLEAAQATKGRDILAFVGLPMRIDDKIFNVTAALEQGKIIGIIPAREGGPYFSSPQNLGYDCITIGDYSVPFGTHYIFKNTQDNDLNIGVLSGKLTDCATQLSALAANGASLILNPCMRPALICSDDENNLRLLASLNRCAIVSVSVGEGESVGKEVYSSAKYIIELKHVVAKEGLNVAACYGDVDIEAVNNARLSHCSHASPPDKTAYLDIHISDSPMKVNRSIDKLPYVPKDTHEFDNALDILAKAVVSRMEYVKAEKVIFGLSGGLDSTVALILCAHAAKLYNLPKKNIICVTMRGLGSSERTQSNALKLIDALKVGHLDVPIDAAVKAHFKDIKHTDETDLTAENAQARERSQILMDLATKHGALVLGTGDLSERALGWCTYGGDQLAHYNPLSSLTKTFIRALLRYYSFFTDNKELARILADILNTPVSPELVKGQVTEDIIGPYELHDFFLYNLIIKGFTPKKVLYLASLAFDSYSSSVVKKYLRVFISRFFSGSFKRNFACDGARITKNDLSELVLPADIDAEILLGQI